MWKLYTRKERVVWKYWVEATWHLNEITLRTGQWSVTKNLWTVVWSGAFVIDAALKSRNARATNDAAPTRGYPYKILCKSHECQMYYFHRTNSSLIWNSLPPFIVDFRNLSSFERTINNRLCEVIYTILMFCVVCGFFIFTAGVFVSLYLLLFIYLFIYLFAQAHHYVQSDKG